MSPDTVVQDLSIDIEEPRSWARRLTITVPAERVERARADVLKGIRDRIKLPGFRKGRVPESVIQRQFGATIQNETLERVVDAAYREALRQKGLEPISRAEVEDVRYEPGAELRFRVEFEVRPEIRLDRVGGFQVERGQATVGAGDVDRVLGRLRSEQASWGPLAGETPTGGDRVQVEITPLRDGEAAEPRRYTIVLGEDQAIPDVERSIQTLSAGDSAEFTIRIPGDGDGDADADAEEQRVRIALIEAERAELPALDDGFAASIGDFESLEVLRERVREDLEREAAADAERELRRKLIDHVVDANPFDVPDAMVTQYIDRIFRTAEEMEPEQRARMHEMARPGAVRAIQRMLVVEAIGKQHDLRPSAEEVDARVEDIARRNDRPVADVWTQLQRSGRLDQLEDELLEEKVFEFLKAESKIEG
ncbi:MAG: trigger factor [Longimicrobiales bacterium]